LGHLRADKTGTDREFIYLLPMAPGKESQAYEMQNQRNQPQENQKSGIGMLFDLKCPLVIQFILQEGNGQ
jgi:hypothetical protein